MPGMNPRLAHDMRMPLQLIFSCAQMIESEISDPAQPAAGYAQMLMENVRALNRMIESELDKASPSTHSDDVVFRTKSICRRFEIQARQAGIVLAFNSNTSSLSARVDREKFGRILMNLISNAIKFTPSGGKIEVRFAAMNDFFEISIQDSGTGIPSEKLSRIFESGETDGGHGFGLSIARDYARQMGGNIFACSSPGRGSCFTLRLPV